jgi:NADH-quinone oxidoreductase subunit L
MGLGKRRGVGYLWTALTGILFAVSLGFFLFFRGDYVEVGGFIQLIPDRLGLLLSSYILLVSLVVHRYSINYMADDPGYGRYFLLLFIMTLSLVTLVLSANLLLIATCWNLMGIILYLFLVHNYRRTEARRYAGWALVTHLISDLFLASAIWVIYKNTGSLYLAEIFSSIKDSPDSGWVSLAGILLMLSAITKSAQFPFHLWLVYSMEGPTPVSALMHAGIVNAGAFLINRFAPFFAQEGYALQLAFFVGSVTAILGSALMLIQSDIKKALGYSTVGQMGYMIMEIGVGAFALAVYHMITHGIFKATLFMISGNVIHSARRDPNIPPKEIYSHVAGTARKPRQFPLFLMVILTLTVPLLVVSLTHLFVEGHIIRRETALIILFFGWITGVQVLMSTFKVGREKPLQTLSLVIASMVVFMLGYVLMSHFFEKLLYEREFADLIYERAFGNPWFFLFELIFLGLLIAGGWIFLWASSKGVGIPLWSKLYSFLARDLNMDRLYQTLANFFRTIRIVFFSDIHYSLYYAASSALLILLAFYDPVFLAASLFMPLFPLSVLVVKIMEKLGYYSIPLFSVGALLSSRLLTSVPETFHFLAGITFLIHAIRLAEAGGLKKFSYEIYAGVMAIGWLLGGGSPIAMGWLVSIPLVLGWASYSVRKRFGTCSVSLLSGIWDYSPGLATLLLLSALFVTGMAPLPSFLFKLELITDESLSLFLIVLLGWFFLCVSIIPSVVRMLSGPRVESLLYRDLSGREALLASGFFGLATLWGVLHLGGVL